MIPTAKLIGSESQVDFVVVASKATFIFVLLGSTTGLFLDSVSAHYTLTDLPLANRVLTTSYAIWCASYSTIGFGILIGGIKLLRLISVSLAFHRSEAQQSETKDRYELERCSAQVCGRSSPVACSPSV